KRLLAQFDAGRKQIEHRKKDWHLQQDGNTSADGIHAYLLIQLELFLLYLLHVVAEFLLDLVQFRFQNTHFSHAQVRFIGEGGQHQFQQQYQYDDDDAVNGDDSSQEMEHRENYKFVVPENRRP